MKRTFVSALVFATCVSLAGAAVAADGAAVYKAKCLSCHGAQGVGTAMGPAFRGSAFIASGSDEEITEVILKGRTGPDKKYKVFVLGMPAQGLGDDDVSAMVKHLKSLAAK
ncbi:MAG TPA: cytochrome c [Thermodesulfobacteriota bacterium]|nr:cytochrome c [Thermodesulfobacteriota bacterium]